MYDVDHIFLREKNHNLDNSQPFLVNAIMNKILLM